MKLPTSLNYKTQSPPVPTDRQPSPADGEFSTVSFETVTEKLALQAFAGNIWPYQVREGTVAATG